MIRAVLDANVVISGILKPEGVPGKVLGAWEQERFQVVTSEAIWDEIGRVLRYPRIVARHKFAEERLDLLVSKLRKLSLVTSGAVVVSVVAEEPSDNRYLECAVEGEADSIVSGDRHLLELGEYRGIAIVTPAEFLEILRAASAGM